MIQTTPNELLERTALKFTVFAEIIGILAVVVSLVFVGVQLQQDRTIARAELGSQSFEYFSEIDQTINDPNFAPLYAKMLQNPDQLSTEEMLRINAFYGIVIGLMYRECYLTQRGVFAECEKATRDTIRRYFGNEYAKTWWRHTSMKHDVELPTWVDDEIATSPNDDLQEIATIQTAVGEVIK